MTPNPPTPTPKLSYHARERCREMGISTKLAKRAVQDPEVIHKAKGNDGRRIAVRGQLAVVYNPDNMEIVTVLWARAESRDDGPARNVGNGNVGLFSFIEAVGP